MGDYDDNRPPIWLYVIMFIVAMVVVVWSSIGNCTHGHHSGECGREYRAGKAGVKTCHCTNDHY